MDDRDSLPADQSSFFTGKFGWKFLCTVMIEIICLTNRIFMVFCLAFCGLMLACNDSLTLNLLCISDCYVIPEGTWRSRGRGTGDFIATNSHYLVSGPCIATLLSSCHSFLLSLANTFVSSPLLLPFPVRSAFLVLVQM